MKYLNTKWPSLYALNISKNNHVLSTESIHNDTIIYLSILPQRTNR